MVGRPSRRLCRVPAVARLRPSAKSTTPRSRSKRSIRAQAPNVMGLVRHRSARAPVRSNSRASANDFPRAPSAARSITLQFNLGPETLILAEQEVQASIKLRLQSPAARNPQSAESTAKSIPPTLPSSRLRLAPSLFRFTASKIWPTRISRKKISQLPRRWPRQYQWRVSAQPFAFKPIPPRSLSYGLSLEDLRTVLGTANVNTAKGDFRRSTPIGHNRCQTTSSSRALPIAPSSIAYRNGAPRAPQRYVANVADGVENTMQAAWAQQKSCRPFSTFNASPGANIISVVDRVKRILPPACVILCRNRSRSISSRTAPATIRALRRRRFSSSSCSLSASS